MHKLCRCLTFLFLAALSFFIFIPAARAQGQKPKADTTQLRKQLANHSINDTGKVVLLYKVAMATWLQSSYNNHIFAVVTTYKMQALALALRLSWSKGILMTEKILGGTFYFEKDQVVEKKLLGEIITLTGQLNDQELKNQCYLYIAGIYGALDDQPSAAVYFNKGFEYFAAGNNATQMVAYLNESASGEIINGDTFKRLLQRTTNTARQTNNKKALAKCYGLQARVYEKQKNNNEAINFYKMEIDQLETSNHAALAPTLRRIAWMYETEGNRRAALTWYLSAVAEAEKRRVNDSGDYLEEYYEITANCLEGMEEYTEAEKYLQLGVAHSSTPDEAGEAWRSFCGYYLDRANYVKAIKADENALQCFQKAGDQEAVGVVYKQIGDIFALTGNVNSALENYKRGFDVYTAAHNSVWPPSILNSMGLLFLKQQPAKAMQYFNQALASDKLSNSRFVEPGINTGITAAYYYEKNYTAALAHAHLTLKDTAANRDFRARDKAMLYRIVGRIIRDAPDTLLLNNGIKLADRYQTALTYLNKSKALMGNEIGETEAQRDEMEDLSATYEKQKNYPAAYDAYHQFITLRDSVQNRQTISAFEQREENVIFTKKSDSLKAVQALTQSELEKQQLALQVNNQQLDLANKDKAIQHAGFLQTQTNLKAEQSKRKANELQLKATRADDELQKTEINNKKVQSYYLYGGIAALLFVSFFIARNYFNQKKSNVLLSNANSQISKEKQRSDDLLLNILPADVAEELKEKGSADARLFDEVTVLFTDFVNFTTVSERLTPQGLVDELNVCFKVFDGIMTTHHIEKIKTVGDAYLAVSGLPNADLDHAANVINAAYEIQQFMLDRKQQMGDKTFGVRIGIHSGSVVAGIVGVKKFAYDIWGDTVNTAARMEQNSEPGKINVSEKTYELVKDRFAFTYRGEIAAKNKGMMKMYFAV